MPTSKPRKERSDEELNYHWRHLYYEHEMLSETYFWIKRNLDSEIEGYSFAVYMDSFLIHARNLNNFYYAQTMHNTRNCPRPRADDIIAEDYCIKADPWNPPLENLVPNDVIKRIDKRLAHLTYQRDIGKRDDYDYQDILTKLESTRRAFLAIVPESRIQFGVFNPFYLPVVFWEE